MYIRKTTHKSKKKGQEYSTYKLVESIRTDRGPRQRTIVNLGAHLALPKTQWNDLANRIEEILRGIETLIPYSEEVEKLAQRYAKLALKKQSRPAIVGKEEPRPDPDYQRVDLHSLKNWDVRTVGAEHLLLSMIRSLQLDKELLKLGFRRSEMELALGSIVARAVYPGSERRTLSSLQNNSALGDLLEKDFFSVSLNQMYQISDRLLSKKEALETDLYDQERQRFNLQETIVLYDLTNTYFEGSGQLNPKAKRGRSKQKRKDCPLVTLALVLDEAGFCKRSRIFEGNVSEPSTLQSMIHSLRSDHELTKPIVVMDAGIATEANLKRMRQEDNWFDYIVVSRKAKEAFPDEGHPLSLREKNGNHVRGVLLKNEQTNEMELYCHSTAKEKKEQSIKTHFQSRFEEEVSLLQQGLHKKGRLKNFEKVTEKVGRIKEKYKKISHLYKMTIKKEDQGNNACSIQWDLKEVKEKNTLKGTYCLRTSIQHFNELKIWNIYIMLTEVEAAFRCMKSELGMRPIFHQKEKRVDGHLFITVLAYHLVHAIRYQLKQENIHDSWENIRLRMATQCRVTVQLRRDDGKMISIRKSSEPEAFHRKIYDALKLSYYPGTIEKIIM